MSKKRKNHPTDAVGKWEFTSDRARVWASTRKVLAAAQERTREIRRKRLSVA